MQDDKHSRPSPEVPKIETWRGFTAGHKLLWALEEADRCTEPTRLGELLRREGLCSSREAYHSGIGL